MVFLLYEPADVSWVLSSLQKPARLEDEMKQVVSFVTMSNLVKNVIMWTLCTQSQYKMQQTLTCRVNLADVLQLLILWMNVYGATIQMNLSGWTYYTKYYLFFSIWRARWKKGVSDDLRLKSKLLLFSWTLAHRLVFMWGTLLRTYFLTW